MDLIFVITPSYHSAHLTSGKAKGGAKTKNHVPNHVPSHVPWQTSWGNSEHNGVVLELLWHTCVPHCVRIHPDCPGVSVPAILSAPFQFPGSQLKGEPGVLFHFWSGQASSLMSPSVPPPMLFASAETFPTDTCFLHEYHSITKISHLRY